MDTIHTFDRWIRGPKPGCEEQYIRTSPASGMILRWRSLQLPLLLHGRLVPGPGRFHVRAFDQAHVSHSLPQTVDGCFCEQRKQRKRGRHGTNVDVTTNHQKSKLTLLVVNVAWMRNDKSIFLDFFVVQIRNSYLTERYITWGYTGRYLHILSNMGYQRDFMRAVWLR